MRIAAFVLGLIFSLVVLFGSFFAGCSAAFGEAVGETEGAESFAIAGGVAFLMDTQKPPVYYLSLQRFSLLL